MGLRSGRPAAAGGWGRGLGFPETPKKACQLWSGAGQPPHSRSAPPSRGIVRTHFPGVHAAPMRGAAACPCLCAPCPPRILSKQNCVHAAGRCLGCAAAPGPPHLAAAHPQHVLIVAGRQGAWLLGGRERSGSELGVRVAVPVALALRHGRDKDSHKGEDVKASAPAAGTPRCVVRRVTEDGGEEGGAIPSPP